MSRDEWLACVRAWRRSGRTLQEFAVAQGLSASRLQWWSSRLRDEVVEEASEPARKAAMTSEMREVALTLVECPPVTMPSCDGLALEVGRVVVRLGRGFDEVELGRVLDVLEARR